MTTEQEYLAAWIWPSRRGWYCRANHQWYDAHLDAVEALLERDRQAGIATRGVEAVVKGRACGEEVPRN